MADKVVLKPINGKLYADVAGTSPTAELTNCRGVALSQSWETADATHRGGGEVALVVPVLKKIQLVWKMLKIDGDADLAKIRTAFRAGTPIALKSLDKAGGHGVDGDFLISKFDEGDGVEADVAADPTLGRALINVDPSGA